MNNGWWWFRGSNLTRFFLYHWSHFSVHGSEFPRHRPPVDFHTTEEWVMLNLHFACDFVFDVTRSLLIMQWTRREYARTKASTLFWYVHRRAYNSHRVLVSSFFCFFLFLTHILSTFSSLFIYLYFCCVRFDWNIAIKRGGSIEFSQRRCNPCVSFLWWIFIFIYFACSVNLNFQNIVLVELLNNNKKLLKHLFD